MNFSYLVDLKKNKAVEKETQQPVVVAWEKMSKSKHNGVDPEVMFNEYGVDTTRLLILADVSPTSHRNWNSNSKFDDVYCFKKIQLNYRFFSAFPGVLNWQKRLWLTVQQFIQHRTNMPENIPEEVFKKHDDYMFDSRNYYTKGTTFNYCTSQQISIGVSKLQGLTNSLRVITIIDILILDNI